MATNRQIMVQYLVLVIPTVREVDPYIFNGKFYSKSEIDKTCREILKLQHDETPEDITNFVSVAKVSIGSIKSKKYKLVSEINNYLIYSGNIRNKIKMYCHPDGEAECCANDNTFILNEKYQMGNSKHLYGDIVLVIPRGYFGLYLRNSSLTFQDFGINEKVDLKPYYLKCASCIEKYEDEISEDEDEEVSEDEDEEVSEDEEEDKKTL